MTTTIKNLRKIATIKKFHTIVSRETIKPSSPTPSNLQIFNLSLLDQCAHHAYIPAIFFYPNFKKSLSQTLNQYHPFAGKFPTPRPTYVNCNDNGVTFLEAFNDSKMDDIFQFNNCACGGTTVAISISHKIVDGCTLCTFMNHWATVARNTAGLYNIQHKSFVFSNSKLRDMKNKVRAMYEKAGTPLNNPSRVEVLTSLIYKIGMKAEAERSGTFSGPSYLFTVVDMRTKMLEKFPETTVGNILSNFFTVIRTDPNETELHTIVAEMRKRKMELQLVKNLQQAFETSRALELSVETEGLDYVAIKSYCASSLYRFRFKEVDFGWGKPIRLSIPMGTIDGNSLVLIESLDGDGIEAQETQIRT
ncbi:acyltransferase-like [Rutidosis leptorrhynchoides]|uniref:acyltransferase-like n=1 Tax=Rutidosis leptorrhynchoides TaxID=125765 RepID=UPI003A995A3E